MSGRHDHYEGTVSAGRDAAPAFRSGVTSVLTEKGGSYERSAPEHRACPEVQVEVYNTRDGIESGQLGVY